MKQVILITLSLFALASSTWRIERTPVMPLDHSKTYFGRSAMESRITPNERYLIYSDSTSDSYGWIMNGMCIIGLYDLLSPIVDRGPDNDGILNKILLVALGGKRKISLIDVTNEYIYFSYKDMSSYGGIIDGKTNGIYKLYIQSLKDNPIWDFDSLLLSGSIPVRERIINKVYKNTNNKLSKTTVYPNPANPSTTISFNTTEPASINFAIYNITGRIVRTISTGNIPVGHNTISWDGRDGSGQRVGSGEYVYVYSNDGEIQSGKITILK